MAEFVSADKGAGEEKAPAEVEVSGAGGMYTVVASNGGKMHVQEGFKGGFSALDTEADAVCFTSEGKRLVVASGGSASHIDGVGGASTGIADSGGLGAFNSISISDDGQTHGPQLMRTPVCVINGTGIGGAWEKVAGKACHIHVCEAAIISLPSIPRAIPTFALGTAHVGKSWASQVQE